MGVLDHAYQKLLELLTSSTKYFLGYEDKDKNVVEAISSGGVPMIFDNLEDAKESLKDWVDHKDFDIKIYQCKISLLE